jgi:acyl carrier protein
MQDKLIEIFSKILEIDPAELNDEISPDNTKKWDSLAAVSLVVAVEETFSVKLSTKEIMKARSIGLVRQMLRKKGIQGV